MKKKRYRLSKFFVYLLQILAIITFLIVAVIFQKKQVEDKVISSLSVVENDNTDYKVYYNQDLFYQDSYIKNSGGNYTRSRVNNVGIDFDYIVNLTDKASGDYNYVVEGFIYAFDPDDAANYENEKVHLWKQKVDEKELGEYQKLSFKDDNYFAIKEHVDVDLQKYIGEYNRYVRSDPSVLSKGLLVVSLKVESKIEYEDIDNINVNKELKIEIPLSDPLFKINQPNQQRSDVKTYNDVMRNDKKRTVIKYMRIFSWVFVGILIIRLAYYYYKDVTNKSLYSRKLEKILSTYDSIIVTVSDYISLRDLNVVKLKSFSEMVDAQSEVRLPINFIEDKKEHVATFILVSTNVAWVYSLKESDLIDEE